MNKIKDILFIIFLVFILLLIISIIIGAIWTIKEKRKNDEIIKNNKITLKKLSDTLKIREDKIDELNSIPPITIEKIKILNDSEKEKLIIKLQKEKEEYKKIVSESTEIIYNLKADLESSNDRLKNPFLPKNELSVISLAGLSGDSFNKLNPDCYIGGIYKRNLYVSVVKIKFKLHLGGGIAVKVYSNYGAMGMLELGISF